jgi:hypothetical protein
MAARLSPAAEQINSKVRFMNPERSVDTLSSVASLLRVKPQLQQLGIPDDEPCDANRVSWLLRDHPSIFPVVERRTVHASDFPGVFGGEAQAAQDTGGEIFGLA